MATTFITNQATRYTEEESERLSSQKAIQRWADETLAFCNNKEGYRDETIERDWRHNFMTHRKEAEMAARKIFSETRTH